MFMTSRPYIRLSPLITFEQHKRLPLIWGAALTLLGKQINAMFLLENNIKLLGRHTYKWYHSIWDNMTECVKRRIQGSYM
jgi:hypothetical protein